MSRWYVLLIAIIPAIAPATIRSTGFRVPSPVSRFLSLEIILRRMACHRKDQQQDALNSAQYMIMYLRGVGAGTRTPVQDFSQLLIFKVSGYLLSS